VCGKFSFPVCLSPVTFRDDEGEVDHEANFPGSSCTKSKASILTPGVVSSCSETDVDCAEVVVVETGFELSRFDGAELL
jgi:hypothetical protein